MGQTEQRLRRLKGGGLINGAIKLELDFGRERWMRT